MSIVFPFRLKQARLMRGLSMEALANKLDNKITKQSISKYEAGAMNPEGNLVLDIADALNVPIDFLFRPITFSIDSIEFRRNKKLSEKRILSIQAEVRDKIERYLDIETLCNLPMENYMRINDIEVKSQDDIFSIASLVKEKWGLGEEGLSNLIQVLENKDVKVIEINAEISFEGISGYINGKIPIIVLNSNLKSEHKRFTALKELGHLMLNFSSNLDKKAMEELCNLFASEMLIPKNTLIKYLGPKRSTLSVNELISIQKQFGISIDALIDKARKLKIITESKYQEYYHKKDTLPDFKKLVQESRTNEEKSDRFQRLVFRALAQEVISISKAGVLLGKSINEVLEEFELI